MSESQPRSGLVVNRVGRTLVLELHRPEVLNALNMELIDALDRQLFGAEHDPDVRAVVLCGNGRAFSAGDDLRGMGPLNGRELTLDDELRVGHTRLIRTMRRVEKPIIAALHGWVLGAACEVALAADLRVAEPSLRLGIPYVSRGLSGGAAVLAGLAGVSVASDMLLTGRVLGSEEAESRGLVHRLVADDEALSAALTLAEELATRSVSALGLTKRALSEHWARRVDDFVLADSHSAIIAATFADADEGVQAFFDKRVPRFEDTSE